MSNISIDKKSINSQKRKQKKHNENEINDEITFVISESNCDEELGYDEPTEYDIADLSSKIANNDYDYNHADYNIMELFLNFYHRIDGEDMENQPKLIKYIYNACEDGLNM